MAEKEKEQEGNGQEAYRIAALDAIAPWRMACALPAWIAIAMACDAKERRDHKEGAAMEVAENAWRVLRTSAALLPTAP